MPAILGIDAAWTETQPSGVALVVGTPGEWRLIAVEPSYGHFHASALPPLTPLPPGRALGSIPVAIDLLASARALGGEAVDLVAVDMPLSRSPIVGRRVLDDAISRAYGARNASTHSPSDLRPGRISDRLRADFEAAGYPLQAMIFTRPGLIEVYPHPALIEFASADQRLRYKAGKRSQYWPDLAPAQRLERLLAQWRDIVGLLEVQVAGVADRLPVPGPDARGHVLKAYEDALDAVICACVGICVLEGRATAFGDEMSSIWVPAPGRVGGSVQQAP